jgi:threonine dehydrogenase-like Zn-dependent dehydrogenase
MLNAAIMLGILLHTAYGTAKVLDRKDPGSFVVFGACVIGIILLLVYMFS